MLAKAIVVCVLWGMSVLLICVGIDKIRMIMMIPAWKVYDWIEKKCNDCWMKIKK